MQAQLSLVLPVFASPGWARCEAAIACPETHAARDQGWSCHRHIVTAQVVCMVERTFVWYASQVSLLAQSGCKDKAGFTRIENPRDLGLSMWPPEGPTQFG